MHSEVKKFTPMELDAIGEIMNISMGASATAVSAMLGRRVDITTPRVEAVSFEDFSFGDLIPAVGVHIEYTEGLQGSNIMLLHRKDVKMILDLLMGMETDEESFELDEFTMSAVCEVMNQMIGSASTSISDFLGRTVNISTPVTFDPGELETFKREYLSDGNGTVVEIRFNLTVEGALESEFINVVGGSFIKELLSSLGFDDFCEAETA